MTELITPIQIFTLLSRYFLGRNLKADIERSLDSNFEFKLMTPVDYRKSKLHVLRLQKDLQTFINSVINNNILIHPQSPKKQIETENDWVAAIEGFGYFKNEFNRIPDVYTKPCKYIKPCPTKYSPLELNDFKEYCKIDYRLNNNCGPPCNMVKQQCTYKNKL
jgi:hypothetical protein